MALSEAEVRERLCGLLDDERIAHVLSGFAAAGAKIDDVVTRYDPLHGRGLMVYVTGYSGHPTKGLQHFFVDLVDERADDPWH